jgi:hypothetical protein
LSPGMSESLKEFKRGRGFHPWLEKAVTSVGDAKLKFEF